MEGLKFKMKNNQCCDCCDRKAEKTMSSSTSKWCAGWFIGYYCMDCYKQVEEAMKDNCNSDTESESEIERILKTLYEECRMEGGDGDALWYSESYEIDEILPYVEKFNKRLKSSFAIKKADDKNIHWGEGQEWVIITTDIEMYNKYLEWGLFVLKD